MKGNQLPDYSCMSVFLFVCLYYCLQLSTSRIVFYAHVCFNLCCTGIDLERLQVSKRVILNQGPLGAVRSF